MSPKLAVALASLAWWGAAPASAQPGASPVEQRRIFENAGTIFGADEDDSGGLRLQLWDHHIRFRLAPQPPSKLPELEALILRAYEGGRSVKIFFDGAGRVNAEAGTIIYDLCAIETDGLRFEPAIPCATEPPPPSPSGGSALALGWAHLSAGNAPQAESLVRRVEDTGDPAFRKLLVRVRAEVASGLAWREELESPAADRFYLSALADYRLLTAMEPDDVEIAFTATALLEELGGYAEARKAYEDILRRWPDEDFRIAVRIGALHRIQGENQRALDQLDELVARNGPQDGMKFRYHRGWTLTRLGRFEEAVAELSEGLKNQPDYVYAHFRRGCAYASLGRLSEAVADMRRGRMLLADVPDANTRPVQFDLRRADAIIAQLDSALAARPGEPVAGTCDGYWGRGDTARPRSPLLLPR